MKKPIRTCELCGRTGEHKPGEWKGIKTGKIMCNTCYFRERGREVSKKKRLARIYDWMC